MRLFELPPRSSKLNGAVKRAQRTHTEEFYEVHDLPPWTVASLNAHLRKWEHIYNYVRPHPALASLTPAQALKKWTKTAPVSHIP
ncbi:MAG: integrase core domain-containing protein [Nitrospinota bacterium]